MAERDVDRDSSAQEERPMGFGIDRQPRRGVAFYSLDFVNNTPIVDTKRTSDVGGRWPNGVIQYFIPAGLDGNYATKVRLTMLRWESCIRAYAGTPLVKFVECHHSSPAAASAASSAAAAAAAASTATAPGSSIVRIVDNDSRADVGYLPSRDQKAGVDIKSKSTLITALPHELGHCIGLAHEHERSDAADGVKQYVQDKIGGNAIAANSNVKYVTLGTPFDRLSIMMYSAEALTILTPKEAANGPSGGCVISEGQINDQSWSPSQGDLEYIRRLYS